MCGGDETYGNVFSHTSVSFRQRDEGSYTIANANMCVWVCVVDKSRGNKHHGAHTLLSFGSGKCI